MKLFPDTRAKNKWNTNKRQSTLAHRSHDFRHLKCPSLLFKTMIYPISSTLSTCFATSSHPLFRALLVVNEIIMIFTKFSFPSSHLVSGRSRTDKKKKKQISNGISQHFNQIAENLITERTDLMVRFKCVAAVGWNQLVSRKHSRELPTVRFSISASPWSSSRRSTFIYLRACECESVCWCIWLYVFCVGTLRYRGETGSFSVRKRAKTHHYMWKMGCGSYRVAVVVGIVVSVHTRSTERNFGLATAMTMMTMMSFVQAGRNSTELSKWACSHLRNLTPHEIMNNTFIVN